MGLDQHLYVRKSFYTGEYISNIDSSSFEKLESLIPESKEFSLDFKSASVQIEIGYWRKANAIHNFFVTHLANGKDDCREIYLYMDDLKHLLGRCNQVLEDKSANKAIELLPTTSGFFFGSTYYDEWYFESLEYTKNLIEKIVSNFDEGQEFIYRASW